MSATIKTSIKQKICDSVEIPLLTKCCFCIPLRRGLLAIGYFNLVFSLFLAVLMTMYLRSRHGPLESENPYELPRAIVEAICVFLEFVMTIFFIVALHIKHARMMKVYLYFEIVYSLFCFVYSVSFLMRESAEELFIILLQLTLQIYLAILIYNSIAKMERDGTVKYVRDNGSPA